VFGHFGRNDPDFTWERTDKTALLRKAAEGKGSWQLQVSSSKT